MHNNMMTLENIGGTCTELRVISDTVQQSIDESFNQINISVERNCCEEVYSDVIQTPTDDVGWRTYFWSDDEIAGEDSNVIVKEMIIRQISTGNTYNIIIPYPGPYPDGYPISTVNCNAGTGPIDTAINDWFTSMALALPTLSCQSEDVLDEDDNIIDTRYFYQIESLPADYEMVEMKYDKSGVIFTRKFTPLSSGEHTYIDLNTTPSSIVICPTILGLDDEDDGEPLTFPDGIYRIRVQYVGDAGLVIDESNVFFMDCETACLIAKELPVLMTRDKDIFLVHHGLTVGSNCGCNYAQMCELYRYLLELLNLDANPCDCTNQTQTTNGCTSC